METLIVWILVAAAVSSNTSPTVIATFKTEAQCEAAAEQVWRRSYARADQPKHYMARLDAVCVPAQGAITR
jgi:hypothetical protein